MAREITVRIDDKMAAHLDEYRDWARKEFGMELMMDTALRDMAVIGLAEWKAGQADMTVVGLAMPEEEPNEVGS